MKLNFAEFINVIDVHVKKGANKCCFRGQTKIRPLVPKTYREEFFGKSGEGEKYINSRMSQWHAESLPYLIEMNINPQGKWEMLAVAQHFGLATTMLDWSSNPLVALFFACERNENDDGEVVAWSFDPSIFNPNIQPEDAKEIVLVRPFLIASRLKRQQGLLALHPSKSAEYKKDQIVRIKIPKESKVELRAALHRFGINHEYIYGTLDHLSESINDISRRNLLRI